MKQNSLVLSYMGFVTLVTSTLGGYVACGAQSYRVVVDDEPAEVTGKTASLTGVHSSIGWSRDLPVKYKISSAIGEDTSNQLKSAMRTWEVAVGRQLFQFEGTEERTGDDFPDLYRPLSDVTNGHYFDRHWVKNTKKSTTVLATTIWENDSRSPDRIVKADVRYNLQFYIFGNALKEYSQGNRIIVDMESLALHELGHLLGLTHVTQEADPYSIMNPSLFIGEGMMTRRLSNGDIERVRTVYADGDRTLASTLEKADDYPNQ